MKRAIFGIIIVSWMAAAQAATALPDAEKHRLASYLAYIVVSLEPEGPGGGSMYTVGANCPECNGVGKVGDGVTMLTCAWEDGLHYCNKGKIAKRSDGDAMDYEDIGDAMCEPTPERDELFEAIENAPLEFNESTVRELQYDLEQALEEAQTLKATCPNCPSCPPQKQTADQPETTVEEPSCLVDLSQTKWNWSGVSDVPISTMREHLTDEHSIDPASLDKMSREELIALHNLLHNEEVRASTPQAKSKTKTYSSGGCPNGRCPTSGSSRSRGFFFRR